MKPTCKALAFSLLAISFLLVAPRPSCAQKVLIYMDLKQTDHLKAYGIAYWALERSIPVEWLLNYRGGSFLLDYYPAVERELRLRGVSFSNVSAADASQIYGEIEATNMDVVRLEKAPKVAIYTAAETGLG